MDNADIQKNFLSRENLFKLLWTVFGFTLFPGLIFFIKPIFSPSNATMSAYYSELFGSLLDLGIDGMYAWCIVCAPYMAYEVYLLIKSYRAPKKNEN